MAKRKQTKNTLRAKSGQYASMRLKLERLAGVAIILAVVYVNIAGDDKAQAAQLSNAANTLVTLQLQQQELTGEIATNSTQPNAEYWSARILAEKNSVASLTMAERAIIAAENPRWDTTAKNPNSTAFGLCQILNSHAVPNRIKYAKLAGVKNPNTTNINEQIAMCRAYITARYGTPEVALAFHQQNGWF